MLTGLNLVLVHVRDMARARAFYSDKLGLTVEVESPDFVQFAQPDGKGATFALSRAADARPATDPELWWSVESADAVHAELVARGVEIVSAPKDEPFGRVLSINDTERNTIYLIQYPRPS